jgi:hypothetical protein
MQLSRSAFEVCINSFGERESCIEVHTTSFWLGKSGFALPVSSFAMTGSSFDETATCCAAHISCLRTPKSSIGLGKTTFVVLKKGNGFIAKSCHRMV